MASTETDSAITTEKPSLLSNNNAFEVYDMYEKVLRDKQRKQTQRYYLYLKFHHLFSKLEKATLMFDLFSSKFTIAVSRNSRSDYSS